LKPINFMNFTTEVIQFMQYSYSSASGKEGLHARTQKQLTMYVFFSAKCQVQRIYVKTSYIMGRRE
jgi:hypothetical protein